MPLKSHRFVLLGAIPIIVGALASMSVATATAAPAEQPRASTSAHTAKQILGPKVTFTGTAPTGYTVTFRIYAPTATRMRIKGEWSFATAAEIAADPTNADPQTGATWRPGDFPLASPNAGSAANWPVTDMTQNKATGVWSYTTPLPSGVFNYSFYPDCDAAEPALTGCTAIADPANPPWTTSGSAELTSQVYVPSDRKFGTTDYSWQAPVSKRRQGTLTHLTYSSPGHVDPTDQNYLTAYTPPGYDPRRASAYPTFYLIHGGGGNELDWSTQGDLANIMDNLIADHEIQPMVVVMPNNPTTPETTDDLIPFVQSHFHVLKTASGRSFAGLSGGATTVQDILFHDTTTFGYYAVWSAPRGIPAAGEETNPQLKQLLGLHLGVAKQDLGGLAQGNTTAEEALLTSAGVPFASYNVNGGHNWSYWRNALRDFLTRVDFRTTTTAVSTRGRVTTVTVKSATPEPTRPTGTVQVTLNGKRVGRAVRLHDGRASVVLPNRSARGLITVTYTGNSIYNASTGTATVR